MSVVVQILKNIFRKKIKPSFNHIGEDEDNTNDLSDSIDISNTNKNNKKNQNELELENYKLNVKSRIHDIKTPLNNIVLSINSEEHISAESKLNIVENAYIIKDLLNDLLKNETNLEEFKFKPKKIHITKLTSKIENLMLNEFKSCDKKLQIFMETKN
jgi:hypothetical protein